MAKAISQTHISQIAVSSSQRNHASANSNQPTPLAAANPIKSNNKAQQKRKTSLPKQMMCTTTMTTSEASPA